LRQHQKSGTWTSKYPSHHQANRYFISQSHGRVFFFIDNKRKVEHRSFANRLVDISRKIDYPWIFLATKDFVGCKLRKYSFPYVRSPAVPPAP